MHKHNQSEVAISLTQSSSVSTFNSIFHISPSLFLSARKSPFQRSAASALLAMSSSLLLLLSLLFVSGSATIQSVIRVTDNPADQLVAVISANRTAHRGSSLFSNPGLACIALQYIKAYQGDCGSVGGPDAKKPPDSEIADTFAPNCGVEATTLSQITGRLLGCETKYVPPSKAFSEILLKNDKGLAILYNKNHTEVGAAVTGTDGGAPYFWCVLFSNGKTNSSFAFDGGVAKITKPGCFSGYNDVCSGANGWPKPLSLLHYVIVALAAVTFAFSL